MNSAGNAENLNSNIAGLEASESLNASDLPVDYDYVVVGSGAGGGPLAANLARAGYRVLLLEAGGDPLRDDNNQERERYTYSVPALHPRSTEDDDLRWSFFVRHYANQRQQERDSKYDSEHRGVLYPRAGTLGGCTAHNAMILVYPHNRDWDQLAEITGDSSWHSDNMRQYFERLERCHYADRPVNLNDNPSRHGFNGWLPTTQADPTLLTRDEQLLKLIIEAALDVLKADKLNLLLLIKTILRQTWISWKSYILSGGRPDPLAGIKLLLDPNDWRNVGKEGICVVPLTVQAGRRASVREYLRDTEQQFPDLLTIKTHALVTRVLFDETNSPSSQPKAIGVEYLDGKHLYRADPRAGQTDADQSSATLKTVRVKREVILSGGAFNTPQLLKLSGIGPRQELLNLGIPVRVDLPGVGANLQDRYEVGVVNEMVHDFTLLKDCTFMEPKSEQEEQSDPGFREWKASKTGIYATNGAVIGIVKKSNPIRREPDLFIFGLPAYFKGYFLKYSELIDQAKNRFTWAILKGHTNNSAGTVTLRSSDPRDVPEINFRYFDEGNDTQADDLKGILTGIEFVKTMTKHSPLFTKLLVPKADIDQPDELAQFTKDEAWGHHACGTCKIGRPDDRMAVLDGDFRVYGTQNLRVVDASVFPYIPGLFIVSAIYMISEKASDVIIQQAKSNP